MAWQLCFNERGDGPRSGRVWYAHYDPVFKLQEDRVLAARLVGLCTFLTCKSEMTDCKQGQLSEQCIPSGDSQEGRDARAKWREDEESKSSLCVC